MKITNFWEKVPVKKEFQTALTEILQSIKQGADLTPEQVRTVLQYANARFNVKAAKSPLTWLKLALSKFPDPRYSLQSILFDEETGWAYATDGLRVHILKEGTRYFEGFTSAHPAYNPKTNSYWQGAVPAVSRMIPKRSTASNVINCFPKILEGDTDSIRIEINGLALRLSAKYYREAIQMMNEDRFIMYSTGASAPLVFEDYRHIAAIMPQKQGI